MTIDIEGLLDRRNEIMRASVGVDYAEYSRGPLIFDYERFMGEATPYDIEEVRRIQAGRGVGETPLIELRRITEAVRRLSPLGFGARIFLKDEAANRSGSFKDRRAALSAEQAMRGGYKGLVAATSGNYGAAVASQASLSGLQSIIIQEAFDSQWMGQPEIVEKARKCEALGAEVIQTTVGPELFPMLLDVVDSTGYFNASLYSPFSIQGIESLGWEISEQTLATTGRHPTAVLCTHAGGGMVTGVGRGLRAAGSAQTEVVGVSVDLSGLHMASDHDFNRKSFTTGHTGFSLPFTTWPDRVDVPKNAARPLRYLDRFVSVSQGSVFFATEALAQLEGLERGPAGNTSLVAAMVLAQEYAEDEVIVVSETEYTGAGKTPWAQLQFAEENGIEVVAGGGAGNPGRSIILPTSIEQLRVTEIDLRHVRQSYRKRADQQLARTLTEKEEEYVYIDTHSRPDVIRPGSRT